MYSSYFLMPDGTITCTTHAPQELRHAIESQPLQEHYGPNGTRLTAGELERYMNAAIRCHGCHQEMQVNRIALAIKFGGNK